MFLGIDWKARMKFSFLVAIITVFLASTGINPESVQSWDVLKEVLANFIANPYQIALFIGSAWAVVVNFGTKGVKD